MIKPCDPRMYVILREDLSMKYIQGQHAIAGYALSYPTQFKEWGNKYVINLSVFNGLALDELLSELKEKRNKIIEDYKKETGIPMDPFTKYDHYAFFEPDLKSELPTAICIFENGDGYVSKFVEGLKLATR